MEFPVPWRDHPCMSVHALNWEPASLTTKSLLVSMALKAGMAAMVVSPEGLSQAEEAYRQGRQLVLGVEVYRH